MIYCLRCSATVTEETAHAGCIGCGEGVFIKSKHKALAQRLLQTTVADKEALLDALEDAIGEETDRECVVIVDADSIRAVDGTYCASVLILDQTESRVTSLDEDASLGFLADLDS